MLNKQNTDKAFTCKIIAWEVTRACNLACRHCRATAQVKGQPDELSTAEALNLIDDFAKAGKPLLIFTGGEPMLRSDIYELIAYANKQGLRTVMSPNGTLIDAQSALKIKKAGVSRCSVSLDGHNAASHDNLRGVQGAFAQALRGIDYLKQVGLEFQINTTVTKANLNNFKKIFALCQSLGAVAWHIFLLVPTGRAKNLKEQVISATEYEEVLNWFYDFRQQSTMHLKATCAPHYYRIMRQRAKLEQKEVNFANFGMDAETKGCLGGISFCFVSYNGQVQPCGYLELNCGNIRQESFASIWQNSKIFKQFRDQSRYLGKCGICEFHKFCGGCRARAENMSSNYMQEEPLCSYQPRQFKN